MKTAHAKHLPSTSRPHLRLISCGQELTANGNPVELVRPKITVGEPPARPETEPLYARYQQDFLRRIVRKMTAQDLVMLVGGAGPTAIIDIIGRTKDSFLMYSDCVSLGYGHPEAIREYFESLRVGKAYDFRYIEALRYYGPF